MAVSQCQTVSDSVVTVFQHYMMHHYILASIHLKDILWLFFSNWTSIRVTTLELELCSAMLAAKVYLCRSLATHSIVHHQFLLSGVPPPPSSSSFDSLLVTPVLSSRKESSSRRHRESADETEIVLASAQARAHTVFPATLPILRQCIHSGAN